jgi:nucleoside-diphosphate-sugar epimerase
LNFAFLKAGLNLLQAFKMNGGRRAVFVGTCLEYKHKNNPLKETDPLYPITVYAQCKNCLRELAELYSIQNDISFAYGRFFFAYGGNENKQRLTRYLIDNLSQNKCAIINNGNLIRDYMYVKDAARSFVKLLSGNIEGAVNICTGNGISLRDFAMLIAEKLGKTEYLIIKECLADQPNVIIGDNTKLICEVGYSIEFSLDSALNKIIGDIEKQ